MDDKLNISCDIKSDHKLITLEGRIDGYWSKQLDEYLDNVLKSGDHSIALDMDQVNYLSSLGIRILIKHAKLYRKINGSFGIITASESVMNILKMAGLNTVLLWQSNKPKPIEKKEGQKFESDGYEFEVFPTIGNKPMVCNLAGEPEKIRIEGYTNEDCKSVNFGRNRFGIGLGAIGADFEDCRNRFGDFIGLGDVAVYTPPGRASNPDYMIKTGTLLPNIKVLYGIIFEGDFDQSIRFSSIHPENKIKFSLLLNRIFEFTGYEQFMMVMLAETSGIVGVSLNYAPSVDKESFRNPFSYPDVKDLVNFTVEPGFRKMMTIITGIASRKPHKDLNRFTRPISASQPIEQHFHSAIFSYHPFKKTEIDIQETIITLFEHDKILSVLHLINDSRDFTGIGESEFTNGICWVAKIDSIIKQ